MNTLASMNIGILSYRSLERKASEEEYRIKRAITQLGHKAKIFRAQKFQMVFDKKSPSLLYDGKPLGKCDLMMTRPSVLHNVDLHISLIDQMELLGIPLFNTYDAILKSKNKIKTMQILDHFGIPIPNTVVVQRKEDLLKASKSVGGFPLIVKQPFGSFGNGVCIVESMRALKSFLRWDEPMYLLQQFVKYSKGKDIRIFVVNGKVEGAMMRSAQKGEFRSNIELGGKGAPVEITEEEASIAIRSVQALNLHYGGVDVMRGKSGPVVLEVNSNPGFKSLEESTGAKIALALAEFAIQVAERKKNQY